MKKKQTILIIRIMLFTGTAISMFFVPWILLRVMLAPLPATVQQQVDKSVKYGFDGIIVYVDEAGEAPAFYTAGYKNRENKTPADPHSLFKIASISKLYDAVAITKLVNSGHLSLDNTVAQYFPEFSDRIENADDITLRMLVQHRSGIANLTATPNFWADPPASSQEALERIFDLPADFKPGKKYKYSNTNYLLLSMLIEKVTGADKFQFIRKEILKPLGLKNTFGSMDEVDVDDVMSGYYVGIDEDIKAGDYGTKLTSMLATAEDVGIFLRALNDGSVFTPGEQEIYSGIYVYEHTGLMPGYQSIAKYHKDIDTVVIQFVNTTNFQGYTWNLSEIMYRKIVRIISKQQKH
ncbi:serine hydrolase domain-containing protein [uncultured Draconibacterium sp.]|uniref:serine hydrolase domain-containing protein n=1 Tax=uncultured Draconibacterium sp. TaxID=1573823 RepID=UPI0025EFC084|nr:serine hydrolase domain-containing protein [uncultured Draconibacterium sp.]